MSFIKSIIHYIIFICTITIYAQSNLSGIVYYESTISQKKIDNYLKNERDSLITKYKNEKRGKLIIQSLDATYLNVKPTLSKVLFNNDEGLYKLEPNLSLDKSNISQMTGRIKAGGTKEYYYNIKEDIYLIKDCDTVGECFIFPNPNLEWQLTQDTKEINGYKVFKATRSEGKVTAWYTPQIPLNFGPKGEYGVPGLILELEFSKTIFKATKIELNPKRKIKVKAPSKGKIVTLEAYKKIVDNVKRRVFGKS